MSRTPPRSRPLERLAAVGRLDNVPVLLTKCLAEPFAGFRLVLDNKNPAGGQRAQMLPEQSVQAVAVEWLGHERVGTRARFPGTCGRRAWWP